MNDTPPWETHAAKITSVVIEPGVRDNGTPAEPGNLNGMFKGCTAMTSADLSGLNTASAGKMDRMFAGCSTLESLDISSFDMQRVGSATEMFKDCSALVSLETGGFKVPLLSTMNSIFEGCSSLESLDLSGSSMRLPKACAPPSPAAPHSRRSISPSSTLAAFDAWQISLMAALP